MYRIGAALYDANVNGWLRRSNSRYLIRCLRDGAGGGVARAFLSDGYKIIDNLDVLMATLDGMRQAGVGGDSIDSCDLTERRMYMRVVCEQVAVHAPELLKNYRSPWTGASGADNPVLFAGFVIANSEVGEGALTITPRLVVQVCRNGATINADAVRAVHLGARLEEGVIRWSDDTHERNLSLITAKTRDTVATFLDTDYVTAKITEMTRAAGAAIDDPEGVIKRVATTLRFTDQQQSDILKYFIAGADLSAGGVMHAVTSAARATADADTAYEMEGLALRAMHLVTRAS
jgi:hypothetical protein